MQQDNLQPLSKSRAYSYLALAVLFGIFIDFVITLLSGLPLNGLPKELPSNATVVTVLTTVTQRGEISKLSSLILTVEGVLLGLSPLLFDKTGRTIGALTVSVTAIGLILSLITIASADSAIDFTTVFRSYVASIALFGIVTELYVGSAWAVVGSKKRWPWSRYN